MTQANAKVIANNWQSLTESIFCDRAKKAAVYNELLDSNHRGQQYFQVTDKSELVGYFSLEPEGTAVMLGMALKTEVETGKELPYVQQILKFVRTHYQAETLQLTVAKCNVRAQKIYELAGFRCVKEYLRTVNGSSYPVVEMLRPFAAAANQSAEFEFLPQFDRIEDDSLCLEISEKNYGDTSVLPFYYYQILRKSDNQPLGKISLRIGHNYHSYYNGNMGYEVDEAFRGNHYSLRAAKLLLPAARAHGMTFLHVTCREENIASSKIIERLGGELLEIVKQPEDYLYYQANNSSYRIYRVSL